MTEGDTTAGAEEAVRRLATRADELDSLTNQRGHATNSAALEAKRDAYVTATLAVADSFGFTGYKFRSVLPGNIDAGLFEQSGEDSEQ